MKTLNKHYRNHTDLKEFITQNSITENESILLQIFTGNCDLDFITDLVGFIKELIPHINIIGSTTAGEIIEGEVAEKSTVLSFTMFEKTKIITYFTNYTGDSFTTAQNLIDQFDKHMKPKVAISFADGLHINGEVYLNAFAAYDNNLYIAGGLAADNATFTQTIVFTQDKILTNGAVISLLYNDDLIVKTAANLGWVNIGKTLTITKAEENIVYEIDNMKAIDLYAKYLGDETVSNLPVSALEFPLLLKKEGFNVARAMISKGDDGSLVFAGNVSEGEKVTFGYGNIETIMQGETDIYNDIGTVSCESIFIYSCMARKTLIGADIALEIQSFSKVKPVSGFFTYGEFFTSGSSKHEILNQTMTVLSLSENCHAKLPQKLVDEIHNTANDKQTLKALARLISETTNELEKANSTLEQRVKEEIKKNHFREKQLMQQSRLAQMGEMISMIAHQWRQPLNAISLTAAKLELKIEGDQYDKTFFTSRLERILNYVQHLSSTIEDFRGFFKPEKEKQEITFSNVIKNTLSIIGGELENNNIRVETEFNSKKTMFSYPNELLQVVLNLIKNAEDVLLENKIIDPVIKMKCYSDDDHAIFEITDNAGGIDESIIYKIFDPYFTTKSEYNGTGLGLYMSKTIIEEHCDGKLSVSNSDEGAVFKIVFKLT